MRNKVLPLAALGDLVGQSTEKVVARKNPELPYVGLEHIESGSPFLLDTAQSSESSSTNNVFHAGDVLFGKLRPYLRKSLAAPFSGYCSTDILVLRPTSAVDSSFVAKLFQSAPVFAEAVATSIGTKMPRTSWAALRPLEVFCPPLAEQHRIAEILDTLDEAIRKTEQVIAKLQQMKQGLLHDLLTRGIDDNGELRDPERHPQQFKHSTLGPIPSSWAVHPLSSVADVDRGQFTHRPRNDPRYFGGNIPFIQTGDIAAANGDILRSYSQTLNTRGARVSREFLVLLCHLDITS
jgi:type I restriction enzyme S subunit